MPHKDPKKRAAYYKQYAESHQEKRKEYAAKYRESHREASRIAAREWYKANPQRQRAQSRAWNYRTKYGITIEQYDALLTAQDGCCAICRTTKPRGIGRFHVDHDHQTGKVRGILCNRCNTTLGWVERFNSWQYVQRLHPSVLD